MFYYFLEEYEDILEGGGEGRKCSDGREEVAKYENSQLLMGGVYVRK